MINTEGLITKKSLMKFYDDTKLNEKEFYDMIKADNDLYVKKIWNDEYFGLIYD